MENTMKMYITADEVAELLGVSRGYAREYSGRSECPKLQLYGGR